jgi:hypothetical protein
MQKVRLALIVAGALVAAIGVLAALRGGWLERQIYTLDERTRCYGFTDKQADEYARDVLANGLARSNKPEQDAPKNLQVVEVTRQAAQRGKGFAATQVWYRSKNAPRVILVATINEDCSVNFSRP